ncbi:hypothetical protein CRG98_007780 [Punica granatum]|uniref:CCHC-type domain-containing protein n=1 Tax=Punica granatum TaxID=22663 RepID=A0A2I0KTQ4_PUNGR|nr:hypothetical protein CRG98_007780 [Punica granatum]
MMIGSLRGPKFRSIGLLVSREIGLCAPEFNLVGARKCAPMQRGLGVSTFPWGSATDAHEKESPLTVYDPKDKEVVLVAGTSSSKTGKNNKKSKKGFVPQKLVGVSKNKGKAKVAADKGTCFYCGKDEHWKRNCHQYLTSLKGLASSRVLRRNEIENVTEPRRSSRVTRTLARYLNLHENVQELFIHGNNDHRDDPTTYEEDISDIDSSKWLEAMKSKMDSMSKNQVWDLVDPPEVAKGYCQKQGVDYEETFSPVAMLKSIRIMLAVAAHYDYEVWQMDVKTAFLNGYIEKDIFMDQPKGFESKDKSKVCKLKRSIYGLKQALRSWNRRFDDAIKSFGFIKNEDEPCVYMKASGIMIAFFVLYVDDILLMGNDIGTLTSVKVWLSNTFSMKDLGEATYILGIWIYIDRPKRLIGLSQAPYLDKVLKRFNMYQSNIGPDHWTAVKNILKYLRRTKDMVMVYGEGELRLDRFTDSDFQSDVDDRKFISSYIFTCNGDAVSWKSSKQETIADSTTETEYIAISDAVKEAVWIRKFVTKLDVVPYISSPVELYCDNTRAIAQAKEPRSHRKSKHIERRYHIIREIIGRGDVAVQKVASADNVADPLTKAMTQQQLEKDLEKMGLRYCTEWL